MLLSIVKLPPGLPEQRRSFTVSGAAVSSVASGSATASPLARSPHPPHGAAHRPTRGNGHLVALLLVHWEGALRVQVLPEFLEFDFRLRLVHEQTLNRLIQNFRAKVEIVEQPLTEYRELVILRGDVGVTELQPLKCNADFCKRGDADRLGFSVGIADLLAYRADVRPEFR